jgi:hypothetical protein
MYQHTYINTYQNIYIYMYIYIHTKILTHKPGGPRPDMFVFPTPTPILADLSYSSDNFLPIDDVYFKYNY